ncbi:MAG TPA: hypothetical protein DCG72_03695 [Gammaproteobacteria bacterium]|nr:hypothetical protein [Gammaproteobacteria bacterium]
MRQISIILKGESDRRFYDQQLAYYTAYHSGVFSQEYAKGKFPKFERGAPKRPGKGGSGRAQTWQQQKMMAMALNAAMGGEFKKAN